MKPKRKYYRKCGCCGIRQEQSDMVRVKAGYSDNGWLCQNCYEDIVNQDIVDFDDDFERRYVHKFHNNMALMK